MGTREFDKPLSNERLYKMLTEFDRISDRTKANYERELIMAYRLALSDIKQQIARVYEIYGDAVTYRDVTQGGRLKALFVLINEKIKTLAHTTTALIRTGIKDVYQESFYTTGFALENSIRASLGFTALNESQILASLKNPMEKINWERSNRENILKMTQDVRTEITQGFIQGRGYAKTAQNINDKLNIGVNKSIRIVRTEGHRVQTSGRMDAYKTALDNGLDAEKIWDATLDKRTRPSHGIMDGEKADEDGWFHFGERKVEGPGLVGVAKEDINCRCTLRIQIKGFEPKVRRDSITKQLIPYTTFEEWKKNLLAA